MASVNSVVSIWHTTYAQFRHISEKSLSYQCADDHMTTDDKKKSVYTVTI